MQPFVLKQLSSGGTYKLVVDANTLAGVLSRRLFYREEDAVQFPKEAESIVVEANEENLSVRQLSFVLNEYLCLKEIIIHDCLFRWCTSFILSDLPLLQTLVVGDHAFNIISDDDRVFSVSRCPSLTSITIGESFCYFSSFSLSGRS